MARRNALKGHSGKRKQAENPAFCSAIRLAFLGAVGCNWPPKDRCWAQFWAQCSEGFPSIAEASHAAPRGHMSATVDIIVEAPE